MQSKRLFLLVLVAVLVALGGFIVVNRNKQIVQEEPADIPEAHVDFGFDLLRLLGMQRQDRNLLFSPAGLAWSLSMTMNGAEGQTRDEIARTLHLENYSIDAINAAAKRSIAHLGSLDQQIQVSIANSIWLKQGYPLKDSFKTTMEQSYFMEGDTLDISSPQALQRINGWVNEKTQGKIPSVIDRLDDEMGMILLNALYFQGKWKEPFRPDDTEERRFSLTDASSLMHPFMKRSDMMQYLETKTFQSVRLPYGDNKEMQMVVLLPKTSDVHTFLGSITYSDWMRWMWLYEEENGTLLLPRFRMEWSSEQSDLKSALNQLGMSQAFLDSANFPGLSEEPTKIGFVGQKVSMEVNEEGTKAAAASPIGFGIATGVGINSEPPEPFSMEVNKPFFFAIITTETQEPLFMGIVMNPAQD
ncbi:MAG: serpin family protein [Candidatus Peribacteraceae bacterium]|jgi:serpin B